MIKKKYLNNLFLAILSLVVLSDLNGKVVVSKILTNFLNGQDEIDVKHLKNGVYICLIKTKANIYSKQIILIK